MKIVQISFQPGQDRDNEKFSDYYARLFPRVKSYASHFQQHLLMMIMLIKHLENHIEAPTQWVCTSHANLVFFDRDFKNHLEAMETEDSETIQIGTMIGVSQYK